MKKNNGLLILLGMVIIIFSACALLFPLGTGFVTTTGENIVAYDFVFGNSASGVNSYHGGPYGGLITAFVLGCVGVFFQLIAFIFSFGQGGKKFVGFLDFLAGLCFAATAILFFLAKNLIGGYLDPTGAHPQDLTLGWGFIAAGVASVASALTSIVAGVISYKIKEA
ncbi:MAG: hypothetical protein WCS90_01850 [Bacilli bacterium]